MSETALSRSIRSALTRAGYHVERVNSGKVPTRGGFYQGASAGTPDTVIVAPASVAGAWLETKTTTGRLRPAQKRWHEKARARGVRVAVVLSAAEAVATVNVWRREGERMGRKVEA